MPSLAIFFWLTNVVFDTAGHLAFKRAAIVPHDSELGRWRTMLTSRAIWLGIVCFVFEFVAWLSLISLVPLSQAVLIGSINIVVVMLAGRFLFDERLDRMRVIGMTLVSLGVALAGGGAA